MTRISKKWTNEQVYRVCVRLCLALFLIQCGVAPEPFKHESVSLLRGIFLSLLHIAILATFFIAAGLKAQANPGRKNPSPWAW